MIFCHWHSCLIFSKRGKWGSSISTYMYFHKPSLPMVKAHDKLTKRQLNFCSVVISNKLFCQRKYYRRSKFFPLLEAYLEPCQAFKIAKSSILDVFESFEYVSVTLWLETWNKIMTKTLKQIASTILLCVQIFLQLTLKLGEILILKGVFW